MGEIKVKFSLKPAFPDQESVELTLSRNDGEWILHGNQGSLIKKDEITKKIPVSSVEQMLSELANVNLPSIPEFAMGLDGTTYQLELVQGFNSVTNKWWGKAQKEYYPIIKFCKMLLSFAEVEIEIA